MVWLLEYDKIITEVTDQMIYDMGKSNESASDVWIT